MTDMTPSRPSASKETVAQTLHELAARFAPSFEFLEAGTPLTVSARTLAIKKAEREAYLAVQAHLETLGQKALTAPQLVEMQATAEQIKQWVDATVETANTNFVVEEIETDSSSQPSRKLVSQLVLSPPVAGKTLSEEAASLFIAVNAAATIIIKACNNLSATGLVSQWLLDYAYNDAKATSEQLKDSYLRKLGRIARFGLIDGQHALANQALSGLTTEFVISEADRIKNLHIRRLFWASAGFATVFGLLHAFWLRYQVPGDQLYLANLFALAAMGAAFGTWLSFSIRKEGLRFEELANLETDLLRPVYRILFVLGLTGAVCLLFTSDALNIEIGNLKSKVFVEAGKNVGTDGTKWPALVAILIGLFCGVSERALAGAVGNRSKDFVASLGGKP